jgi:hypothetical protein
MKTLLQIKRIIVEAIGFNFLSLPWHNGKAQHIPLSPDISSRYTLPHSVFIAQPL